MDKQQFLSNWYLEIVSPVDDSQKIDATRSEARVLWLKKMRD